MRTRWLGPGIIAFAVLLVCARVLPAPWRWAVGDGVVDGFGTHWFFWYVREAMAGRTGWIHTDLLFFPWGKDVYVHTGGNLLDAVLAAPLIVVFGSTLGYNLWIALLLAGNGWAGARLGRAMGARDGWPAGLALILNPYVLYEIEAGRPMQAFLVFPALATAWLWTLASWRQAVLAGVAIGISGVGYWYYGLVLGVLAGMNGLLCVTMGPRRIQAGLRHLVVGAVALMVALPFAWPMLQALTTASVPGLLALDGTGVIAPLSLRTVEGDAEGVYVLALLRGKAGSLIDDGGLRFNGGAAPLLAVDALVLAWAFWKGPARGRLAVWCVVALVIASGPAFVVGDELIRNPIYLAAVSASGILRRWWWPGRAVFVIHLVAAGAVARMAERRWVGAALLLGAMVQLLPVLPLSTWNATVPAPVRCLATLDGAVVDVPYLTDQRNLWFQTTHHRPLLGGMLVKKPAFGGAQAAALVASNSYLAAIGAIGERRWTSDLTYTLSDREAVLKLGYHWILVRTDWFRRPVTDRDGEIEWESEWTRPQRLLERAVEGRAVAHDDSVALYAIDPVEGARVRCPE